MFDPKNKSTAKLISELCKVARTRQKADERFDQLWSTFFSAYYPVLCGFFKAREANPQNVEDLALGALAKIAASMHQLKSPRAFNSWSITIARNYFANWLEKERKEPVHISSKCNDEEPATVVSQQMVEAVLVLASDSLHEYVSQMDLRCRELIRLRHYEGLTEVELGIVFGQKEGTVSSWLSRCRETLAIMVTRSPKPQHGYAHRRNS